MDVKGSAVIATREFVLRSFGEAEYARWLAALSDGSKRIFEGAIMTTNWYPEEEATIEPTRVVCQMFGDGDKRYAWQVGRFSAEYGLKSVYKVFIKVLSLQRILKMATKIFETIQRPAKVEYVQKGVNDYLTRIHNVTDTSGYLEQRWGGFIERVMEIAGAKCLEVTIVTSTSQKLGIVEFRVRWGAQAKS